MKAIAVFLSLYISVLCCIPCPDVADFGGCGSGETTHALSLRSHTNETRCCDNDHCSPFCTCQCCHANFYVSNTPFVTDAHTTGFTYLEFKPDFTSVDLFDFLIPPKA